MRCISSGGEYLGKKDRQANLSRIAGIGGGPISSAAGAAGQASAAYFDAEARKEVARQEVHKAAVGANAGIMHELDKAFLDYNAQVGTAKKPATLNIQLSILSAYMLGVIAEKAYNDGRDLQGGGKLSEFANNALQIRAPLTALSGEYKLGPAPPAAAAGTATPAQVESARAAIMARLQRAIYDAIF